MTGPPVTHGYEERLRLVPGVSCAGGHGVLHLATWHRHRSLGPDREWKRAVLTGLAKGNGRPADLATAAGTDTATILEFVSALNEDGWLISTVSHLERTLYTLSPESPLLPKPAHVSANPVLSRFTVIRREDDRLVVESPLAHARLETRDPAVAALIGAATMECATVPAQEALPHEARTRLFADLQRAGLVVPGPQEEDHDLRLAQWAPHELWFHRRSRMHGRSYTAHGYGRTQWARGRFDPLPARREPHPGPTIELPRPDLARRRNDDPTLTATLEDRRSTREHDDGQPITSDQLGELLYRCFRLRGSREVDGVEYASRPYPSGGAAYELELYPVVRLASGLDPGMYHYDPDNHQVQLVCEPGPQTRRLMAQAGRATLAPENSPQVLILISARFGRVMWTYEQMPYSLILKHVGVLYQTMYLVATAMGLAACGLGGGDAAGFNEATGVDYLTESVVGEFLLGSPPPDRDPGGANGPATTS